MFFTEAIVEPTNTVQPTTIRVLKYTVRDTTKSDSGAKRITEYFVPSYNLCFNAKEGILSADKPRNTPEEEHSWVPGITYSADNPCTAVRLPETLVQQIVETREAYIELSRKQYELQEHLETINAASSDTMTNTVPAIQYYNQTDRIHEYFIPSCKLCFNKEGIVSSSGQPRNWGRNGTTIHLFGFTYDNTIPVAGPCQELKLPETFVQKVQDTYELGKQYIAKKGELLNAPGFISACSDITVPAVEPAQSPAGFMAAPITV